jgi:hypothetical protein
MNKLECSRISLDEEIELLRSQLNQQKDLTGQKAISLSMQLDRLILVAMREKGYRVK